MFSKYWIINVIICTIKNWLQELTDFIGGYLDNILEGVLLFCEYDLTGEDNGMDTTEIAKDYNKEEGKAFVRIRFEPMNTSFLFSARTFCKIFFFL